MASPPAVELEGVACGYGRQPIFTAVSLTVPVGQFAAVVGPTGSGKTTLLRSILGLLDPLAGAVRIFGRPPREAPGRIGYVPQIGLVDWDFPMTVQQVVLMGCYRQMGRWPWPTARDRRTALALLDRLGIAEYAQAALRELSGGQQQRVFLARALVGRPPLLVLDEPTAGVDLSTQHEILHLLGELNGDGITILLTTHDLNAVAAHLPWVICFNRGVVTAGDPGQVLTTDVLGRTYQAEIVVVETEAGRFMAHATPLQIRRPDRDDRDGPPR